MGAFQWISDGPIPHQCDLRQYGWRLASPSEEGSDCILVAHAGSGEIPGLGAAQDAWAYARRLTLVGGVNTPGCRAKLIRDGFGDAVGDDVPLVELDARARRLADLAQWLPRHRRFRQLTLDLLAREATHLDQPLRLHPMEFAMLWRLSETPDEPVPRDELMADASRPNAFPSSSSMAVQLSRLRSKLALAGLSGLIETVAGGYLFKSEVLEPAGRS